MATTIYLVWAAVALRPDGPRTALVFVGTASYAGLMWLVTWQALRGQ